MSDRAFWPVASRSTTRPVKIAFANEASTTAVSCGTPSATSRASMFVRHSPICSPRTWRGRPSSVASNAVASMPSRTIARLRGDAVIHRHHARSRSACDMPGRRSSQPCSTCFCTTPERCRAATIRSSFDPKWCTSELTLIPSSFAIGRNDTFANPCRLRYTTTSSSRAVRRSKSTRRATVSSASSYHRDRAPVRGAVSPAGVGR